MTELKSNSELVCNQTGERYQIQSVEDEAVLVSQIPGVTLEWDRSDVESDIDAGNFTVC